MSIIERAIKLIRFLRSDNIRKIKFKKADGSDREMMATLNFDKIPKKNRPKKMETDKLLKMISKNKIIHVYDTEKDGWRSVNLDRIEWIEDDEGNKQTL